MSGASIGNWKFFLDASPIEEVFSVSPVGKTNALEDVTNFDSPSLTKEFIAGLAEGDEITIQCNYLSSLNTQQLAMMAAVDAKQTRSFKLSYIGVTPSKDWTFNAVCLKHGVGPQVSNKSTITFIVKISGNVTHP
jgi:hypothetical protein